MRIKILLSIFTAGIIILTTSCKDNNTLLSSSTETHSTTSSSEPQLSINSISIDWSKAGQPITMDEARSFTTSFTENVGGVTKTFVSRQLLEEMFNIPTVRGVCFRIGSVNNRFTVVAIPTDVNGTLLQNIASVNENRRLTWSEVQTVTNNLTANVNGVKGRLASKEIVEREFYSNDVNGVWLYCATHKDGVENGKFTFVGRPAYSTSMLVPAETEPLFERLSLPPP